MKDLAETIIAILHLDDVSSRFKLQSSSTVL